MSAKRPKAKAIRRAIRGFRDSKTFSIFDQGLEPLAGVSRKRFPFNSAGEYVERIVWPDLQNSNSPLIISGYSSLDRFLDFSSTLKSGQTVRFLVGNEPSPSRRKEFQLAGDDLPRQAEKYWLARGISLFRSASLIKTIELLKTGQVQARYMKGSRMLHAKIYCGAAAATVGSSNFTSPGLRDQHEVNARFERDSEEHSRFEELTKIGEGYWSLGRDYSDRLATLLEMLLKPVGWDEALARASAELLEGEWAELYMQKDYLGGAASLWPSQKQGIAQALQILDQQGSVLIADATGAGKTKMGVYLVGAVHDLIVRTGRLWHGKALMISPPAVVDNWRMEVRQSNINLNVRSHGELSHSSSRSHENRIEELTRSQLLCVDEGHNFLNLGSQRTQLVLRNLADHVVMLTATPINRGVTDLLRVADILGADNLSDSTLTSFGRMLKRKRLKRPLTQVEALELRKELKKFTVRRTKRVLNALVGREPDAYRDRTGRLCKFPKHHPKVYSLQEPDSDREIARQIVSIADNLVGATHFVKAIEMPAVLRKQGITEPQYLQGRLRSARTLARYLVMRALRSSRAAVVEHIYGTADALQRFGLKDSFAKDETGNQFEKLAEIIGKVPANKLQIDLPDWLSDSAAHERMCQREMQRYEDIAGLVGRLSDQRERRKCEVLNGLLSEHNLVLAFDSRPISLAVLRNQLTSLQIDVLLAWGDASSDREQLLTTFAHGSTAKRIVGLCSDSLAEGVNLQQASAIVHLDMPSVVRIAEQRVGRVDRMDSPHRSIEAWWPRDAPEFSLTSDDRFIERFETVDQLLGSNVPLPEHLKPAKRSSLEPISVEQMIEELESEAAEPWDGIEDAFSPVRRLVDGADAIISRDVYERYRQVRERVQSRISLVSSDQPWAFFCLSAGGFSSPRWIFIPGPLEGIQAEVESISISLRQRLGPNTKIAEFDSKAVAVLNSFLNRLPDAEKSFLSRKKQRAIDQLVAMINKLIPIRSAARAHEDVLLLQRLLSITTGREQDQLPDWEEISSRWLDVIRPVWFERLNEPRNKPLLLRDISRELESRPDWLMEMIRQYFSIIPVPKNVDERVRACIVGVGEA